jgi:hypothetical protein
MNILRPGSAAGFDTGNLKQQPVPAAMIAACSQCIAARLGSLTWSVRQRRPHHLG